MNRSLRLALLVPLSVAAFCVLFVLPDIDLGWIGSLVLLAGAWVVWYLLWQTLQEWSVAARSSDTTTAPSPGEWQAWIGLLFTAAILVYYASRAPHMVAADGSMAPEASVIGRHVALLVICWLVVMRVVRGHWRDRVDEDERDRQIQARATTWAHCGLSVFVLGLALMLAFSPLERLRWAVPMALANILVGGLIATSLLEYLVTGIGYWRDRRDAAA